MMLFPHHQPAHSSPQVEIAVTSLNSRVPRLFLPCAMSTFIYLTSPEGSMHVKFTLEVPCSKARTPSPLSVRFATPISTPPGGSVEWQLSTQQRQETFPRWAPGNVIVTLFLS